MQLNSSASGPHGRRFDRVVQEHSHPPVEERWVPLPRWGGSAPLHRQHRCAAHGARLRDPRPETRDPRPEARDPRSANRDPRSGQEKAPEVRVTSAIPEGSPQVEMAGIEPASVGILPGLLRAQFVKQLLRSWSSHEHVDQRTELSKSPIDTPNMCRQQWLPS